MAPREVDLLISGGCVVTMDAERRIYLDGAIAVSGDRIVAVGPSEAVVPGFRPHRRVDASGCLVLPGLIDCHNHPIHYLSKGIADDQPVEERWRDRIWPYEACLTAEQVKLSATGTFIEMIRHGTTCFHDPGTFHPDAVAAAAMDTGIRGVVSRLTWDVRDPSAPQYEDSTQTALEKGEAVIERWHGAADGRLKGCFSLVRGNHVTDALCQGVKQRASDLNVGIHGHLCTTRSEVETSVRTLGYTPLERYRRLGILGPELVLVHMGWVKEEEIQILADHDVSVCHCPSASMLGGFGCIAHGHFPEMVNAAVRVVLGSDACAISRFVDMVRIMYLAACGHKDARMDPTVIGAHKALEMATVNAARALLWEDEIGSLETGKAADIVLFNCDDVTWHPNPLVNPVANLIYSASGSDARLVMIAGRIVMEDGVIHTIDEGAFLREANSVATDILSQLNIASSVPWPVIPGANGFGSSKF